MDPLRRQHPSRRLFGGVALLSVVVATVAVVGTYSVFSQTFDEPLHIASGLEWIQYGSYTLNTENPPMARVATGMVPFLAGARLPPLTVWDPRAPNPPRANQVGNGLLYRDDHYVRNLAEARVGVLPFLWVLAWIVWLWAARGPDGHDAMRAAIAVVVVMTLPPILAHSGLATTDLPFVALFAAALYSLRRVIERGTIGRALLFAVSLALASLAKFSTLVFLGPACLGLAAGYVMERGADGTLTDLRRTPRRDVVWIASVIAVAFVVTVWAGYRFSFGRIADLPHALGYGGTVGRTGALPWWTRIRLPAPELWHGLLALRWHVRVGQPSFLLGRTSQFGFWNYYPVALGVKTPVSFLIFCVGGIGYALAHATRQGSWPYTGAALAALGIVAACLTSPLNYGSRHVLVVYPLLAIAGAWGWREMCRSRAPMSIASVALVCVLIWQGGVTARAYPDFLPYFNELAGRDPGRILIDSDLDWGQDFLRLGDFVRSHQIRQLHIAFYGTVLQCRHGMGDLMPLEPGTPTTGWIAISESYARESTTTAFKRDPCDERPAGYSNPSHNWFTWLTKGPPAIEVGRSIRVYHVPEISSAR